MTQSDRLDNLIQYLTDEMPEYREQAKQFKTDTASKFRLFRSLVNVRPPRQASSGFLAVQDEYLRRLIQGKGIVRLSGLTPVRDGIYLWQGDYGLFQCVDGCKSKTYDNEELIRKMAEQQKDIRIPSGLVPKCPLCGKPMTMNLRRDNSFVQDKGWYAAASRYEDFLGRHEGGYILFLEFGVGGNTPAVIKYPFRQMTAENKRAVYICVNKGEACCPGEIAERSVCINADIGAAVTDIIRL